jgi:hypothetical protein
MDSFNMDSFNRAQADYDRMEPPEDSAWSSDPTERNDFLEAQIDLELERLDEMARYFGAE